MFGSTEVTDPSKATRVGAFRGPFSASNDRSCQAAAPFSPLLYPQLCSAFGASVLCLIPGVYVRLQHFIFYYYWVGFFVFLSRRRHHQLMLPNNSPVIFNSSSLANPARQMSCDNMTRDVCSFVYRWHRVC